MSDLSTANLKRLLDQATPGPWEYKLEDGYIMDDLVETLTGWIQTNDGETVLGAGLEINDEQELRNLALAALAPELAADWLRIRDELTDFRNLQHEVSTDSAFFSRARREAAELTRNRIDRILGDHDG